MSAAVVPLAKPRCFNGTDASSTNTSYIITVIIIAIFTRFQSIFSIIVVSCENKRMVVISCESSIVQFKILISLDFVLLPFPGTTGGSGHKRPGTLALLYLWLPWSTTGTDRRRGKNVYPRVGVLMFDVFMRCVIFLFSIFDPWTNTHTCF